MFHSSADAFPLGTCYKLRPVLDASAFQLLLMVVTGWLARRERHVAAVASAARCTEMEVRAYLGPPSSGSPPDLDL